MDQSETMMPTGLSAETMAPKTLWQKWGWWIIAILVVAILAFVLFWFNLLPLNTVVAPKYQAVFLSNGQVYFGQLKGEKGERDGYVLLSNIYYLQQVNVPVQQTAPAPNAKDEKGKPISSPQPALTQPDIRLVKLGSELHGPEDMMYIAKSQIVFYEDLKGD